MSPFNRTRGRPSEEPVLARAVPVGFAVGAYGISYGVLAVAAGLHPALAVVSSIVVLAGGSQFAFVGVIASGGSPWAGAMSGLLLNLRFVAFGAAIAPHLGRTSLPRRLLDSYFVVDESVALAIAGDERDTARRYRVTALTVIVAWIASTALGAYGGSLVGDPETLGLDAAFPAGFLALLVPFLRSRDGRVAAAVGIVLALALTPVAPPGVPIIAAGLGALVALPFTRRTEGSAGRGRDGRTAEPGDATADDPTPPGDAPPPPGGVGPLPRKDTGQP